MKTNTKYIYTYKICIIENIIPSLSASCMLQHFKNIWNKKNYYIYILHIDKNHSKILYIIHSLHVNKYFVI